jgi:hypothetical protein
MADPVKTDRRAALALTGGRGAVPFPRAGV